MSTIPLLKMDDKLPNAFDKYFYLFECLVDVKIVILVAAENNIVLPTSTLITANIIIS